MSAIGRRVNKLRALIDIRHGPGAAILPPNITKIHLEFAQKWNGGHFGPRKFWQKNLPRLKYYNPTIPMIVNRSSNQEGPATLSIYMRAPQGEETPQLKGPSEAIQVPKMALTATSWKDIASSSQGAAPAPQPDEGETIVKINVKHVTESDIWQQFVDKTGAQEVEPSPADQEEIARTAEMKEMAAVSREVQLQYREKLKQEKMMLERARQEADALKSD